MFGSVPGVGSRAGDGRVGGPGGRAGSGLRPPGTRGWAWVPAGSGLDLVPCSGLSVSLALLGKVWVLGLGRGAACGGRRCPGREALRQASGSAEVAEGQATKGSSGGGGRQDELSNRLQGRQEPQGRAGGPPEPSACPAPAGPAPAGPAPGKYTQHEEDPRQEKGAGGWGSIRHKRNRQTRKQNRKRAVSRAAGAPRAAGRMGVHPTAPRPGGALLGGVTHPGAAERAGGQARGGPTDGPGPGDTGAQAAQTGCSQRLTPQAAPAQRRPGSAQGGPAVPPASHQAQEGPGPWGSSEPQGAAGGLGAPLPPTQKLPHIRGPKPQAQRAERGPQHGSRA